MPPLRDAAMTAAIVTVAFLDHLVKFAVVP
jgi:hypothetical protein